MSWLEGAGRRARSPASWCWREGARGPKEGGKAAALSLAPCGPTSRGWGAWGSEQRSPKQQRPGLALRGEHVTARASLRPSDGLTEWPVHAGQAGGAQAGCSWAVQTL